jgi:hypothetical protein
LKSPTPTNTKQTKGKKHFPLRPQRARNSLFPSLASVRSARGPKPGTKHRQRRGQPKPGESGLDAKAKPTPGGRGYRSSPRSASSPPSAAAPTPATVRSARLNPFQRIPLCGSVLLHENEVIRAILIVARSELPTTSTGPVRTSSLHRDPLRNVEKSLRYS